MRKVVPTNASLIPEVAKKVFTGQLFDVYQWPQEMFDGGTKTFEMLKRPDTVQVIGIKDGKIVMVNDEQPGRSVRTHFPGGRVDEEDESWLTAAQREMLEETGMTFKNWRLVGVEQPQGKIEWFTPWFLATDLVAEVPQKLDVDGEKIEVVLWDFDAIRKHVLDRVESTLNYALPLMNTVDSMDALLALPIYKGHDVNR